MSECLHVEVSIEQPAHDPGQPGLAVELDAETEPAAGVHCRSCGALWPLEDAPAHLVARALTVMLSRPDRHMPALSVIRLDPAVRRVEVVDLLAEAIRLDAHRDAR